MRWKGVEWIDLAHGEGKVTGCCEYGGEPLGSKIFFSLLAEVVHYFLQQKSAAWSQSFGWIV